MRIAYIVTWDMGSDDGVVHKIEAQTQTWIELGHDVRVFAITQRACIRPLLASRCEAILRDAGGLVPGKVQIGKFFRTIRVNYRLQSALKKWGPNVSYMRFQSFIPGILGAMKIAPTAVEINSDDVAEARIYSKMWGLKSKLREWYNLATRGILLGKSAALISMTQEMLESPHFKAYSKKALVVPNSVPEDRIAVLPRRADLDPRPMVMLSASGGHTTESSHWHGVDKVMRLASVTVDRLRFMIVGGDLVVRSDVPTNVTVLGMLPNHKLKELYADCDVAFGTLGLHRKGMNEACAFKVRDALENGVPVISGCADAAFLDSTHEWLLQLPNEESNLDDNVDRIVEFCCRWQKKRFDIDAVMKKIGMKHLEQRKLNFLESLCKNENE